MRLLTSDTLTGHRGESGGAEYAGIYELDGEGGSGSQIPRLVNVVTNANGEQITELTRDNGTAGPVLGGVANSYHAISQSGAPVFFTAEPPASGSEAVYARETKESGERETVELSSAECKAEPNCTASQVAEAHYQGAAADGSKVFFTTEQQLLGGPADHTLKLYEYDFEEPGKGVSEHLPTGAHLVQLSVGNVHGAQVAGVIRTSDDGSHVYFVAQGVLTAEANGLSQHAEYGGFNLYGVDTETGVVHFVATLGQSDQQLWTATREPKRGEDEAQTTPDGRFLVFTTHQHLVGEDTNEATGVYRYDFETGDLLWLSQPDPGLAGGEGKSSAIAPLPIAVDGANADIDDWNRAISGCPPGTLEACGIPGAHDGEYVIFSTAEQLAPTDTNKATDVYLWHCRGTCEHPGEATVTLISDGHAAAGVDLGVKGETSWPAMSASGSDIFFFSETALVPGDADELRDLYDARIDGGFPGNTTSQVCSGEACQKSPSPLPTFGSPGSEAFGDG